MGHPRRPKRDRRQKKRPANRAVAPQTTETNTVAAFAVGTVINGYRIVKHLGGGGMAATYKARHDRTGALAVVKVLRKDLHENGNVTAYFDFEAACLKRFRHQHLPGYIAQGTRGGQKYLITTYAHGQTLGERFPKASANERDVQERVDAALKIIRALIAVEGLGLVHRDLKLENVIADEPLTHVALIDFGLARSLKDGTNVPLSGTPDILSPQQAAGEASDVRNDQFSLAVTLYQCFANKHPASGTSLSCDAGWGYMRYTEGLAKHRVRFIPLHERNAWVPRPLADAIMRMLSMKLEDRFANWFDVARAFLPFASAESRKAFMEQHAAELGGWALPAPEAEAKTEAVAAAAPETRAMMRPDGNEAHDRPARRSRYAFYALVAVAIAAVLWRCGRVP